MASTTGTASARSPHRYHPDGVEVAVSDLLLSRRSDLGTGLKGQLHSIKIGQPPARSQGIVPPSGSCRPIRWVIAQLAEHRKSGRNKTGGCRFKSCSPSERPPSAVYGRDVQVYPIRAVADRQAPRDAIRRIRSFRILARYQGGARSPPIPTRAQRRERAMSGHGRRTVSNRQRGRSALTIGSGQPAKIRKAAPLSEG